MSTIVYDENGRVVETDHAINILSPLAVGPLGLPAQVLAVNSAGTALEWVNQGAGAVTGTGASPQLAYWSAATVLAGNASFNLDTANGILLVGAAAAVSGFSGRIQTYKTGAPSGNTNVVYSDTPADAPFFSGAHARGTAGAETATQATDVLVRLNGLGHYGGGTSNWHSSSAKVEAIAQENFTATARGTYLSFSVTRSGTTTLYPTGLLDYQRFVLNVPDAGISANIVAQNTDNTNAISHASHQAFVGGASGGDPYIYLGISGATDWTVGVDNSDSDKFKIGHNAAVGTNTDLTITTSGAVSLTSTALAGGNTALTITPAAHTAGVAEILDLSVNLSRTVTFTHSSVPATQRAVLFTPPTYATSSLTDTITTAATLAISGPPAAGTGITITSPYSFWVQTGNAVFDGNVGIGTGATPSTRLHVKHTDAFDLGFMVQGSSAQNTILNHPVIIFANTDTTANNGVNVRFNSKDSGGTDRTGAGFGTQFTARAAGSITADFYIYTTSAGASAEKLRLTSGGELRITTIGSAVGEFAVKMHNPSTTNYATTKLQFSGAATTIAYSEIQSQVNGAGPGSSLLFYTNDNAGTGTLRGSMDFAGVFNWTGNVALTAKITTYNAIATAANGVASIVAAVDLTAQGAAIASSTLYAVPAASNGIYRITWYFKVTRAATTSSTVGGANGFQIGFTDATDSVVIGLSSTYGWGANSNNTRNDNSNTTGAFVSGTTVVWAKASTNILYAIDYTSSGVTTMQYELHIRVQQLG